jgi:hypothetical protein
MYDKDGYLTLLIRSIPDGVGSTDTGGTITVDVGVSRMGKI